MFQDADCEAAKSRHIGWPVTDADARAILVEVPVEDVVAAILDSPVAAIGGEDALGAGLFRRLTGDTKSVFDSDFTGLLEHDLAFGHKNLADMRKVDERIQRRAAPDTTGFDPAVIGR